MKEYLDRTTWAIQNGGMPQIESELLRAYQEAMKLMPAVFVEIGSYEGGTLYVYAGCCTPGATIISVDIEYPEELRRAVGKLEDEGFDIHFVQGDSGAPETTAEVLAILDHRKVDLLHIDGDHSEGATRKDWETYGPLVRQAGMTVFHDISPEHEHAEVHRVWAEAKAGRDFKEFEYPRRNIGTGVVWL
jgi:cephalosporin hydroxylase